MLIALLLPAVTASAATLPATQTGVGVSHPAATRSVGLHQRITAGQRRDGPRSQLQIVSGHCVATEAGADGAGGAARSTNFIVHPNGDVVPVPEGAVGPSPVDSGKGFQFTGGSGGRGLDPRTTDVRIMDPVTTGKYQYPNGYVSYSNSSGQAVNPYTGQTVGKSDPWWHWPF